MGFALGAFLTLVFRLVRDLGVLSQDFAVIYIFSAGYLTNAVAESMHTSGIIACLFSGMTMGIYLRPSLEPEVSERTEVYLETAAKVADLTVFIMVGITTALIKSGRGCRFGFFLFFCVLGRIAAIGVCALICNGIRAVRGEDALIT